MAEPRRPATGLDPQARAWTLAAAAACLLPLLLQLPGPLAVGLAVVSATVYVACNLAADLTAMLLDPRQRLAKGSKRKAKATTPAAGQPPGTTGPAAGSRATASGEGIQP